MMRFITCLMLSSFALTVNGAEMSEAQQIFDEHFIDAPTGILQAEQLIFLVVRQQCVKQKKYSGTPEKKLATASVMGLFQEYVSQQELSISRDDITFKGDFGDAIYAQMLAKSASDASVYQSDSIKLIDKDTGNCERLLVYALPEIPKKVRNEDVIKTTYRAALGKVWLSIFSHEDLSLLANWGKEASFDALSTAIDSSSAELLESEHQAQLDVTKLLKDASDMYRISIDPHRVVYSVLTEQNLPISQDVPAEYRHLALNLFQQANQLFEQGKTPKIIYRKLSLSLNLMPNQAKAWDLLGALYRAFKQPQFAVACHQQAIRLTPMSTESWLHLAKSMQMFKPDIDLSNFYSTLSHLPKSKVSAWGQQQIKLWKQDQIQGK